VCNGEVTLEKINLDNRRQSFFHLARKLVIPLTMICMFIVVCSMYMYIHIFVTCLHARDNVASDIC